MNPWEMSWGESAPWERDWGQTQPAAQPRSTSDELLRQGGLLIRHLAEGASGLPALVMDPINRTLGLKPLSEAVSSLGTRMGLPQPESDAEKLAAAGSRGMVDVATGRWLAGALPAANAVREFLSARMGAQAAAGAGGGIGSEVAKEQGAGVPAQMAAGLVGGFTPGVVGGAVKRTAMGARELVRPLTNSGQDQIAADALGRLTRDRTGAIQALQDAQEIVPGSRPTAAQASGDLGLISAERSLARTNAAPFTERKIEQNTARTNELRKLNATDEQVAAYEQRRSDTTTPLREQAFANASGPVDYAPVAGKIAEIAVTPEGGRSESRKALEWIAGKLGQYAEEGRVDPANAYELHKDVADLVAGRIKDGNGSALRLAGGLANQVKQVLAQEIEKSAPGFQKYMETYARMSGPIDRLQTISERLGGGNLSRVTNAAPVGSEYALSQAKLLGAVRDLPGLAPRQSDILQRVLQDANRATNAEQAVRVPGSDTMQNLAALNLVKSALGQRLGGAQLVQNLVSRPLAFAYKPAEARIQEKMAEGLLDPQMTAALLRKARKSPDKLTLDSLIRDVVAPRYYGGLLGQN